MERTYEPVILTKKLYGIISREMTQNLSFSLIVTGFFICLGQAYAMTGDENYAKAFVSQMTDWTEKQPLTPESRSTTWRTIEAGLRGEYWCKAITYFKTVKA